MVTQNKAAYAEAHCAHPPPFRRIRTALHCRYEYLSQSFFAGLRLHKRSHKFLLTATRACVCARAFASASRYRHRKTRRTIFLRAVMRYPADCLQRTFLSRATNKNASPTDIEKSLGGITAEIYARYPTVRASRACKRAARAPARYASRCVNYSSLLFRIREMAVALWNVMCIGP